MSYEFNSDSVQKIKQQLPGRQQAAVERTKGETMWKICGQELSCGEKRQILLKPGMEDYEIPATLICGQEPGKTLVVTAQIHAGEYNGTPAVVRTAKDIDPEKL